MLSLWLGLNLVVVDCRFDRAVLNLIWQVNFDFLYSLLNISYNNKKNGSNGFPHLGVFPWHSPNLVFSCLGLSSAFCYFMFYLQ